MSAFLMDMQSLNNLVRWFYFETDREGTYRQCKKIITDFLKVDMYSEDWDKVFIKELYALNCYSLNQRYGDDLNSFPEFEFKGSETISKIQALKLVQCWLYQSCEGDSEKKPLFKLMQKIENILLNAIVSDLEEYKTAKWG